MSRSGGRGRRLSQDEHSLWDQVTRSIRPLRVRRAKKDAPPDESEGGAAKSAAQVRTPKKPAAVAAPVAKATASVAPSALDRKLRRQLARGSEPIEARLDLHGCTQAEAHTRLLGFLRASRARGATIALVITGKGQRGDADRERGVLKRQVPHWLGLPEFREHVVSFGDAAPAHGGEGALYIRLRRKRAE